MQNLAGETFTESVIKEVNDNNKGCVFILWGAHAHKKGKNINQEKASRFSRPAPITFICLQRFFWLSAFLPS